MATFIVNEDNLEPCPYNPAHRVKSSRFQAHVIKCREKFQSVNKQVCPYNARHYVSESEFQHHLATCSDKEAVDKKVIDLSKDSTFKGRTAVPSYFGYKLPEEENWENDNNDNEISYSRELSICQENEERAISTIDSKINSSNSDPEVDKNSCAESNFEDKPTSIQKDDITQEKSQNPVGLSKEKLLERALQSMRQPRGISFGRGRGVYHGTCMGEKFSTPKNPVGLGRGISPVYNKNSSLDKDNERNTEEISEKIKALINFLPPCEPGEVREIPKSNKGKLN
ncbi:protein D7-like isoform X1 [Centruroides sculpturatus]|uniref:protein D7-like isoform X1 n=1 Tax=Centruroides sculpturatus TaxID=218467 RepID=UPI000C6ECE2D|nr:protein D7-like isoform X1 [Centruroides sculpturatus]XP_023238375.1 protein D7-like isoform X1 [Centruroides sculpturatus]